MSEINLPEGWFAGTFADVITSASNGIGGSQSKDGIGLPVSRIETIADETINFSRIGYIADYDKEKIAKHKLNSGDILFSHINSPIHLGKTAIFSGDKELYHGINLLRIIVDRRCVLPKIFNSYCKYIRAQGEFSIRAQHAVNQSSLNQGKLLQFDIPIPPLAEQKQIAQKLDELLAQVDTLKTRLDAIPNILKRFRQSVLAVAVSGRLTEGWRGINETPIKNNLLKEIGEYWAEFYKIKNKKFKPPVIPALENPSEELPESWISTQIGYIFDVHVGATPSRAEESFWGGEVNWVSSSEVSFCRIKSTKEKITEEGLKSASTTVHPKGTVMLAMIGQGKTRGQVGILDIEACHNQNTAALRVPEDYANSMYLYFYLTKQYEETRRVGSGNNQQALNKATVQGLPFPLPPLEEQTEIVRRVEQLFAYADQIEQRVKDAQARVNHLTQSILAKAFRGELTADWRAQNPELISGENSAAALLEWIKAERNLVTSKKKPKR